MNADLGLLNNARLPAMTALRDQACYLFPRCFATPKSSKHSCFHCSLSRLQDFLHLAVCYSLLLAICYVGQRPTSSQQDTSASLSQLDLLDPQLSSKLTMAAIKALLNPTTSFSHDREQAKQKQPPRLLSPINSSFLKDTSPSPSPHKKPKICKDQPVFTRGPVRGQVRYPPHQYKDQTLSAYHQQFDMFPMEDLEAYPRHIPYNSEKRLFQDKTGRDFFEGKQHLHCGGIVADE